MLMAMVLSSPDVAHGIPHDVMGDCHAGFFYFESVVITFKYIVLMVLFVGAYIS